VRQERILGLGYFSGGRPPCAAGFGSRLKWSEIAGRYRAAGKAAQAAAPSPRETDEEPPPDSVEDLEIIEELLALALEAISRKTPDVRLGDVLKLLEFKHRVKPEADAREIFWEWIGRFRREAAEQERNREKASEGCQQDVVRDFVPGSDGNGARRQD